jgi:hypothetical protein
MVGTLNFCTVGFTIADSLEKYLKRLKYKTHVVPSGYVGTEQFKVVPVPYSSNIKIS